MWILRVFVGVTGLVTTDHKNARDIDVNLWAMTDQETGEYGVSHAFTVTAVNSLCISRVGDLQQSLIWGVVDGRTDILMWTTPLKLACNAKTVLAIVDIYF